MQPLVIIEDISYYAKAWNGAGLMGRSDEQSFTVETKPTPIPTPLKIVEGPSVSKIPVEGIERKLHLFGRDFMGDQSR
jgi:hypothetical protein